MILGIFDHLWQSTLFTLAVGLLAFLTMRNNQANVQIRPLWLAASLKFLIPFSLLIGVGKAARLGRRRGSRLGAVDPNHFRYCQPKF